MKMLGTFVASLAAAVLLTACETIPPGAERGPGGTIAYDVQIEASEPGARIEVNGEYVGDTPLHLKIYGDTDGTFHDFGSAYYVIRALPITTNQYAQSRVFGTGHMFGPEDRIPGQIYFDMNMPMPVYAPGAPPLPPVYAYPPYGSYYYSPHPYYYYGPRYYHGHRHGLRAYRGVPPPIHRNPPAPLPRRR